MPPVGAGANCPAIPDVARPGVATSKPKQTTSILIAAFATLNCFMFTGFA